MSPQRPQDLVFTLYGEYFLHREGSVWVGSLISLLEQFGMSEASVRTVLSRMTRKGWLEANRVGRNSFYDLSDRGRALLEEGAARIYHPSWDSPWDGSWFLLSYSIPEIRRHLRDRLRDRLAWLGFGSLGNGLWISPHDVEDKVREASRQLGIEENLECFRGHRVGDRDPTELVDKCWDLQALNERYTAFLDHWLPHMQSCTDATESGALDYRRCFTLRFSLLHEFRSFPLEDPYLPRSLLPPDWKGEAASRLFTALHDLLEGPAESYLDEVLAATPAAPATAGGIS
jgi:phenylacetic acid degradation operon negative regulatory protein